MQIVKFKDGDGDPVETMFERIVIRPAKNGYTILLEDEEGADDYVAKSRVELLDIVKKVVDGIIE